MSAVFTVRPLYKREYVLLCSPQHKMDFKKTLRQPKTGNQKNNMKDFEAILTGEQKKTLKEMKQEGRKKYQEAHKNRPPMPGHECRKPF